MLEDLYRIRGKEAPRAALERELVQTGPWKLHKGSDGGRYGEEVECLERQMCLL